VAPQIRQLHPLFVGEATGIDLRDLTDRTAIDEIAAAARSSCGARVSRADASSRETIRRATRYRRDLRRTTVEDSPPALPLSRSRLTAGI
jgi:hypothetical protein